MGLEPALALVTTRLRWQVTTTLYLSIRIPPVMQRWTVDTAASAAVPLVKGEPLAPQVPAAITLLERPGFICVVRSLCGAKKRSRRTKSRAFTGC